MPLENASVEMINEKKHIFTVKDKFKNLMFKTNSKEDMIGWYQSHLNVGCLPLMRPFEFAMRRFI